MLYFVVLSVVTFRVEFAKMFTCNFIKQLSLMLVHESLIKKHVCLEYIILYFGF